jgi:hypothetical protein
VSAPEGADPELILPRAVELMVWAHPHVAQRDPAQLVLQPSASLRGPPPDQSCPLEPR